MSVSIHVFVVAILLFVGVGVWLQTRHFDLLRKDVRVGHRRTVAWLGLHSSLPGLRAPLPVPNAFTASPELLGILVDLVSRRKPKQVLELGSGVSTVVVGYALEAYSPGGRIDSVDAELEYAEQTRERLKLHGLHERAAVHHGPLAATTTDLGPTVWYDDTAIKHVKDIDMLIVDGPPGAVAPLARHPAFHRLKERLSPTAVVVVDDANREPETEMVRLWMTQDNFEREYWDVEKGVVLLTRRQAVGA